MTEIFINQWKRISMSAPKLQIAKCSWYRVHKFTSSPYDPRLNYNIDVDRCGTSMFSRSEHDAWIFMVASPYGLTSADQEEFAN